MNLKSCLCPGQIYHNMCFVEYAGEYLPRIFHPFFSPVPLNKVLSCLRSKWTILISSDGHCKQNSTSTNANPQTFFHNFHQRKSTEFATKFLCANANANANHRGSGGTVKHQARRITWPSISQYLFLNQSFGNYKSTSPFTCLRRPHAS